MRDRLVWTLPAGSAAVVCRAAAAASRRRRRCRFSNSVSSDDPLTSSDASCLTRCHPGFCLIFVSFLQNYPNLLVRPLHLLFMSARLRLQLADPFRHGDGTPRCRQLTPIAGTTWLPSTPYALVRLTRAVMPALCPTPASASPSEVRPSRQQSRLALRAQLIIVTCLAYCRVLHSILLGRNRFTTSFDG